MENSELVRHWDDWSRSQAVAQPHPMDGRHFPWKDGSQLHSMDGTSHYRMRDAREPTDAKPAKGVMTRSVSHRHHPKVWKNCRRPRNEPLLPRLRLCLCCHRRARLRGPRQRVLFESAWRESPRALKRTQIWSA